MIPLKRTTALLESVSRVRIGVIGDFCLDAYWHVDEGRPELSLETGKPTMAVKEQRYDLGGAGNVVHNLVALGTGGVTAFGVLGNDMFGHEIRRQLSRLGVTDHMVLQERTWQTSVYAKPHLGTEEQQRIDFGRFNNLSDDSERALVDILLKEIGGLDGLVINQQLPKSIFTDSVLAALDSLPPAYPGKIFLVDARHRIQDFSSMLCKLNAAELARLFGRHTVDNESVSDEEVEEYAKRIYDRTGKPVFITRSRSGILVYDGTTSVRFPAPHIDGPTDPVGAGDTVVAALAAVLSAGSELREAAAVATYAAGVTVQKLRQTGTATPAEILAFVEQAALSATE